MEKQNWEKAVEIFLSKWKNNKEVIGALVCGSYVTGNPSKHSDIDLHIILSNKSNWKERGNVIINGFLIEYFANSPKSIKNYMNRDYENNSYHCVTMFLTGKIIFDKNGEIAKLNKLAHKFRNKEFIKLDKTSLELEKYGLWSILDDLQDNYIKNLDDFYYVYYNYLKKVYDAYCVYNRMPITRVDRALPFLTDKNILKKYMEQDFTDTNFVNLFLKALKLSSKDLMMKNFEDLTNYVLKTMGGFKIDGWKTRSKVKK